MSYRLRSLEERIGTPLFIRTTRSVTLTDPGRSLLARARPAMTELTEAIEEARTAGSVRKGTVRVTLPYDAYHLAFADRLAGFHRRFPEISLELSFDEAFVDILGEGFHAGVRLGGLVQGDMVVVRLCRPFNEVVFATPAYFQRYGRPEHPADLLNHNCIRYRYIASGRIAAWQFGGPDGPMTVDVRGNLIVNSTTALIRAVRDGLGIAWLFRPSIQSELEAGDLEAVLECYAIERPGYFLYYPRANARLPAFRAFIDFFKVAAGGGPAL